jgi:hypothetical protein
MPQTDRNSNGQEISKYLRNPQLHYHVHKTKPPESSTRLHIYVYLLNIRFNIILPHVHKPSK